MKPSLLVPTSCRIPPIVVSVWTKDRQTDRQTWKQTDRQIDRQTLTDTDRHRQIDTDKQTVTIESIFLLPSEFCACCTNVDVLVKDYETWKNVPIRYSVWIFVFQNRYIFGKEISIFPSERSLIRTSRLFNVVLSDRNL